MKIEERLTKRIADYVYYTQGKYSETLPAECESQDVREILKRLAAYEDTGLLPAEIAEHEEIFKAYRHVCGGLSPEQIEAMKAKQIPKEPEYRMDHEFPLIGPGYYCTCGVRFEWWHNPEGRTEYCGNCGQRLK